jgi:putative peptidoglycan lipid II flippase
LHRRRMVSLASLDYREMGRCLGAAIAGGAVCWIAFSWILGSLAASMHFSLRGRFYNLAVLIGGTIVWGGISLWVLRQTGSALPRIVMRRLRLA